MANQVLTYIIRESGKTDVWIPKHSYVISAVALLDKQSDPFVRIYVLVDPNNKKELELKTFIVVDTLYKFEDVNEHGFYTFIGTVQNTGIVRHVFEWCE